MAFKSYTFEIGGIRRAPGRLQRYMIARGSVQELNFIDAYRKVTGDHASILCKGDTYTKIVAPNGQSVTIITQSTGID